MSIPNSRLSALPWLVTSGALVTGVILGKVSAGWGPFTFKLDLDPVAILGLLITIAISLVFYRRFEKGKHSDRLRKEAVLDRLKGSVRNLDELEDLIRKGQPQWSATTQLCAQCRKVFTQLNVFAERVSYPIPAASVVEYMRMLKRLLELLTDTPILPTPNPPVSIVGGSLVFTPERFAEIQDQIVRAGELLQKLEAELIIRV